MALSNYVQGVLENITLLIVLESYQTVASHRVIIFEHTLPDK